MAKVAPAGVGAEHAVGDGALEGQGPEVQPDQGRRLAAAVPGQVQGAQVAADHLQAPVSQVGVQPPPATGEIQHPAPGWQVEQGGQGRAFLRRLLSLVRVDGEVGGMVEVPNEPVHGPSVADA